MQSRQVLPEQLLLLHMYGKVHVVHRSNGPPPAKACASTHSVKLTRSSYAATAGCLGSMLCRTAHPHMNLM